MPVWLGILLLPVIVPVVFVASLFGKKTEDRNADEVAGFLRDFINDEGGEWDWDEFESVAITDAELEAIRREAVLAGPRERRDQADFSKLRDLLARAEAISRTDQAADAAMAGKL